MKPMLKNTFFSLVNDLLARGITPELKVSALTSYGNLKWEDGDTTRVADLYSVRDCSPLTASTFRKRFIKWFDEIIAAYHAAAAENLTEGQKVLDGDTVRTVTAFRKTVLRDSNGLPINQECPRSGVILLDGKYEVMAGSVKPYTQDNINLSQQILESPRSLFAVANNVVRAAIIETAYAEALEENDMFDGIIRDGLTPQQRAIQTRREGIDIYGDRFKAMLEANHAEALEMNKLYPMTDVTMPLRIISDYMLRFMSNNKDAKLFEAKERLEKKITLFIADGYDEKRLRGVLSDATSSHTREAFLSAIQF